jgi:hypothetical protein
MSDSKACVLPIPATRAALIAANGRAHQIISIETFAFKINRQLNSASS